MAIVKLRRLQGAMLSQCRRREVYGLLRTITTSSRHNGNHYDALGVTPNSTQRDIKSAYYKLSKLYHPDKSSDELSAKKFRAITEAYEVLGNIKLKKMYDRGLLGGHQNVTEVHYQPEPEPADPTLKFYKSHAQRHVAPTMEGTPPVYDFDSWSKQHYGDIFKRTLYEKELLKKKREKQADTVKANNQEAIVYLLFAVGGICIIMIAQVKSDLDQDLTAQEKAQRKQLDNVDLK